MTRSLAVVARPTAAPTRKPDRGGSRALAVVLAVLGAMLLARSAAADGLVEEWKFDQIRLKSGNTLNGLVLEDAPGEVRFQIVHRKPGRPTVLFYTTVRRSEIDKVVVLTGADHDELVARVQGLDPSQQVEDKRKKDLELASVGWGKDKKPGLMYTSDHFVLVSNADPEIVRRAAVRLEQIYVAYRHLLPPPAVKPTTPNVKPVTTILLAQTLADYEEMLKGSGRDILNPAFYDADKNEILCVSELQDLGNQLEGLRRDHAQQLDRLRQQEKEIARLPRGEVRARAEEQVRDAAREIKAANKKNEELFRLATQQLFQTLYHEAFHAYLANFVYPPDLIVVPRWLNEGLAQVFETAMVEAGELRVGHLDAARVQRVKTALARNDLVPLRTLLASGPKEFVVGHGQDRRVADRHYLTSWALVHYLAFERKVLTPKALAAFVEAVNRDVKPEAAFRDLVGGDLDKFEKDFHQFFRGADAKP